MNRTAKSCILATLSLAVAFGGSGAARAETTHAVEAPKTVLVPGKAGAAKVSVVGRNGWHVNEEAPITLRLKTPAGVAIAKADLSRTDLAESKPELARFEVQVTAAKAGTVQIPAEARFVMCQESACKPVKENVTLVLLVEAEKASKRTAKKAR